MFDGSEYVALLDEVRHEMMADTATLLLLDAQGAELEPVASSGLDRTSRLAFRVPVGQGFAGRIAQTRAPLWLESVTEDNVINPVLRRHGVQSLAGVPLLTRSGLLGVLHVGSRSPRSFEEADLTRLAQVGQRVTDAVLGRATAEAHTAALVLQRSLLPSSPPRVSGLDLAVRYIPAEGDLGGDWFDVFELPGGRVGIVMGDVVGHGLDAAVVMGRLRSSLRAYALDYDDPAEVLTRLDRKISHFEPDVLATVIYGISSAPFDEFVFSSAGHWPPLVAGDTGPGSEVPLATDPLLGLDAALPRRSTSVRVRPGDTLCLFTDGLVETRSSPSGSITPTDNVSMLAGLLSSAVDAESNCRSIVETMVDQKVTDDDIALLVLKRSR